MKDRIMKLYGYAKSGDSLLELREVTAHVDADTAQRLGEFFLRCAAGMRGAPNWEHEHFDGSAETDVIVYSSETRTHAKGVRK